MDDARWTTRAMDFGLQMQSVYDYVRSRHSGATNDANIQLHPGQDVRIIIDVQQITGEVMQTIVAAWQIACEVSF